MCGLAWHASSREPLWGRMVIENNSNPQLFNNEEETLTTAPTMQTLLNHICRYLVVWPDWAINQCWWQKNHTKVDQIFGGFSDYSDNHHFLSSNWCCYFCASYGKNSADFHFNIWSHWYLVIQFTLMTQNWWKQFNSP